MSVTNNKLEDLLVQWGGPEGYEARHVNLFVGVITDEIKPAVIFLRTGAWYNPDFSAPKHRDSHGNPNVLTQDLRTSALSQGPAFYSAFVEVKRFTDELPEITVHDQPEFVTRTFNPINLIPDSDL